MSAETRNSDRKAVGLLVQLKHPDVGTFAEEWATNLSPGGMFLRSRQPQPVGTRVNFEVKIAEGVRVLRGAATVRWVREAGDPAGPPGMGVQFLQLDEPSRLLIDRMLASRPAGASEPAPPPAPAPPSVAPSVAPAFAPPAVPRPAGPPAVAAVKPLPAVAPVKPLPAPAAPAARAPAGGSLGRPAPAPALDALFEDMDLSDDAPAPPQATPAPLQAAPERTPPPPPPSPANVDISFADLLAEPPPAPSVPRVAAPRHTATPLPAERDPFLMTPLPGLDALDLGAPAGAPSGTSSGTAPEEDVFASVELTGVELAEASPLESTAEVLTGELLEPAPAARTAAPRAPAAKGPAAPPPPAPPAGAPLPTIRRDAAPPRPAAPAAPVQLVQAAAAAASGPARRASVERPVFLTPPQALSGEGVVIGIDLGTSNSCVAVLQKGRPTVLRSKDGYNIVPSVVSLTDKARLLVGHRAKSQLLLNPVHTIAGAKRLVGRQFDSPVVQQVREHFHYQILPDEQGRAAVQLRENALTLEEVQGLVLRECREMAEQQLGVSVGRAVVTVPAYYSEPQREAVRRAGAMAGIKVERILNEPTAAALAYGLNRELDKKVLVYDLGGGTFDATVMRIQKNVFEVLATGGDTFLGGVDFDNALVDFLLQRFQEAEKVPFAGDSVAISRVADAAERAKMALSERTSVDVDVPMLMMDASGTPRHLRLALTRDDLNRVCGKLVDRTLEVLQDVLLDAKIKAADLDDIILVGGQSRMPLVREKLKELFGRPPQASVNADEAVALGAALFAETVDRVGSVVLVDVLPMTVGIGLPGGVFQRVLERNSPLPAQRSFLVATQADNETSLELNVFQGEDWHVASNEYLGTVRIDGLPRAPKGVVKVAVTLRLDVECVLHVEAKDMSTRREVKATLATRYSPEELQSQLGFSRATARGDEARAEELRGRAGRFWGKLKRAFGSKD
jgi:uncharacterized protein (TIGR02266 family)